MKSLLYILIVASTISACNASGDKGNKIPELSSTLLQNYQPDTNRPVSLIPDSVLPIQPTIGSGTSAKLNPAHGQPGHDCAVAVGAPLNKAGTSQPVSPNPISSPSISLPGTISQLSAPNTTPNTKSSDGKLNPAHGQPGHRCDIAVGQPLNAPAKATTSAPISTSTPVSTTPTSPFPVQPAEEQPASPFPATAKLNPAHGQPGHDCKIAVGQPLKQ
ncbi:MAG: hypothetical protein H0V30_09775 [Chitinophagaceae bacterium]|jgi:hypothetical protein|nr:hypothetical protein [Chitinophagaceae bacterium]